ncbi:galactose mutarotase-like isoform X2 [Bacillus rossius redtenbacheri]|uniref:galactose mutarotase-like isoform X2 n=1 Tax=Bacillus rossius redtenbacheri TaxID=93214 RepID=UPI002FDD8364
MTNHGPRTTLALLLVGACLARGTETAPRSKGISRDAFGSAGSQAVDRYTLRNGRGAEVQVMSYGATVTSVKLPDRSGGVDDVVLGFDDLDGYLKADNPYFGAVVGRVANRIKNGRFKIGNETYQISLNDGNNTLHGGLKGFDKKVWSSCVEDDKVVFSYLSSDGEEGFPGAVLASVTYQLTDSNELKVTWKATSTKPTPINLTNHSYFNLCGHANGSQCIYEHLVKINADYYTVTDHENIPTESFIQVPAALWSCGPTNPGCSSTRGTASARSQGKAAACTGSTAPSASSPRTTPTPSTTLTSLTASFFQETSTSIELSTDFLLSSSRILNIFTVVEELVIMSYSIVTQY